MTHTFAISAYGDSPYLESCLKSLAGQSVSSEIIICTSTPSDYIDMLAEKYDVPVHVRTGEAGIGYDWNFAYQMAGGDMVTIAHQDDMYKSDYVKTLMETKEKYPDMSVFMTGSISIKNGKLVEYGPVEVVKKLLRVPLRVPYFNDLTSVKKAALRLGNPIICPSCAYDKALCGESIFSTDLKFTLDWNTLLELAEKKGRFICVERPLIMYRVHADSATGEALSDGVREKEESDMFDRLLPETFAGMVKEIYKKSYDAYKE